jgi:hypothetical protein
MLSWSLLVISYLLLDMNIDEGVGKEENKGNNDF